MGQLEQQHEEHKARLDRLWNPPRRVMTPTLVPAAVAPVPKIIEPPKPVKPPIPSNDDQREARLLELQQELRDLSSRVKAELSTFNPAPLITPAHPSVQTIIKTVCVYYRVTLAELCSQRRVLHIVRPRHVAMYLAKHLTLRSLPDIGRRLGGRDHTTILSGIRRIEQLRRSDPKLDEDITVLTALLAVKAAATTGGAEG